MADKDDLDLLQQQYLRIKNESRTQKFVALVEDLLGTAVDKAIEAGKEHGPDLVAAVVEGAARAAVSAGIEKLQQ